MFHDDMYGNVPNKRRPLATASLILGILSILLCSVIYLALPFGALAVILAILSHTEYKMAKKSRVGLICGLCGIAASIVVTIYAFQYVLNNPTIRSYLEQYIQMYLDENYLPQDLLTEDPSEIPIELPQNGGTFL